MLKTAWIYYLTNHQARSPGSASSVFRSGSHKAETRVSARAVDRICSLVTIGMRSRFPAVGWLGAALSFRKLFSGPCHVALSMNALTM